MFDWKLIERYQDIKVKINKKVTFFLVQWVTERFVSVVEEADISKINKDYGIHSNMAGDNF